jgi:hypothetical protein
MLFRGAHEEHVASAAVGTAYVVANPRLLPSSGGERGGIALVADAAGQVATLGACVRACVALAAASSGGGGGEGGRGSWLFYVFSALTGAATRCAAVQASRRTTACARAR